MDKKPLYLNFNEMVANKKPNKQYKYKFKDLEGNVHEWTTKRLAKELGLDYDQAIYRQRRWFNSDQTEDDINYLWGVKKPPKKHKKPRKGEIKVASNDMFKKFC